jgi:hypothetical protein
VLEFGGTSAVDEWMAACKGGGASDGADEVQGEQRVQPTDALLALSLDTLLWVSDAAPWRFTPAASTCAPLVDLLRSPTTPWDLRLMALLLWATGGGPASLRAPPSASDGLDGVSRVQPSASDGLDGVSRVQRLWGEYAAWLPTPEQQTHLVCFCSGAERDALQDSQLVAESEWAQQLLARYWDEWFAAQAPLGTLCCTHAAVQWAMAAVRTRAFSLDLDDATCTLYPPQQPASCELVPCEQQPDGAQREAAGVNTGGKQSGGAPEVKMTEGKRAERAKGKMPAISAIAPFADMLNHSTDASTSYGVQAGEFRVALCASRNAGAEAMLCYQAAADNRQLMRTFGFTVPGNPHDRLPPPSSGPARALYDEAAATGLNRVRKILRLVVLAPTYTDIHAALSWYSDNVLPETRRPLCFLGAFILIFS